MAYATPRTDYEVQTRTNLDTYFSTEKNDTFVARMVAQAILAKYTCAVPLYKIAKTCNAFANIDGFGDVKIADVQKVLTRMVRAKIMRSRLQGETRLYEVNF